MISNVDRKLKILTERELLILKARINRTLDSIAKEENVSRERIRQLLLKATGKLNSILHFIRNSPFGVYYKLISEAELFKYLIENNIVEWYDIENDIFFDLTVRDKLDMREEQANDINK